MRLTRSPLLAALMGGLSALAPHSMALAEPLPGAQEYAAAITTLTAPRWGGPRVPYPTESDRPPSAIYGRFADGRLAIHAPTGTHNAAIEAAVRGATRMSEALRHRGFAPTLPDGDLGGGAEFDVYLATDLDTPYEVRSDGPVPFNYLDGIVAHAVVSSSLPLGQLEACAAEAVASALLAELDPAESVHWRTAVAHYLSWLLVGDFDACSAETSDAQREPHGGYTAHEGTRAGALFLALLSLRSDLGDARYVRETWTMARQRTWEGSGLRASPDVWEAISTSASLTEQSLDRYLVDAAVLRHSLGVLERERSSTVLALGGLGAEYAVPYAFHAEYASLPIRTAPHEPALNATGSAYTSIDVSTAGATERLRVFLRGEASVRWSLVAILLGPDDTYLGRVEAPVRERAWDAYLTVELGAPKTVIIVVTNLGAARPDADAASFDDRTFHLMIDRAAD